MRNSDRDSGDLRNKADEPPNSRLFIVCSKSLTEEDFRSAFEKFGNIEEVWIVKDRQSGDPKGVAYIKYSKTSEAAVAMEAMHGEVIGEYTRPLKVMIASSRDQGSKRDDNEDRLLRLFIVVPKKMTQLEIRDYFKRYGDVMYVKLVRDGATRESKGFAYVKYHKMSHAAKAFEECDRNFRAVFARPRETKGPNDNQDHRFPYMPFSNQPPLMFDRPSFYSGQPGPGDIINNFPNPEGYTKLTAFVSPSLKQDMVTQLFNIIPGMEVCRFCSDSRSYNSRKVFIQYSFPQAAAYAREKLNGFEYPPGQRIVIPEIDFAPPFTKPDSHSYHDMMGRGVPNDENSIGTAVTASVANEISTLTKALADATALIKAAGLVHAAGAVGSKPEDKDKDDQNFCSAQLPPQQPFAPLDTKCAERLFIVCQPGVPPMSALWDAFGRFGTLIEVHILNGRNCGYVSYGSKESAEKAIETLHGQQLCSSRLKVMLAEPPNQENRKRQRIEEN